MKKKLIGLIIGIFSFSIVSASSATELKLATFEPPKAFIASKILAGWATKVNQCSAGALNVKMYAGGVLGSPPKQYDIVTSGVADISWTVLGYIGGQFPLSSVIELPFLTWVACLKVDVVGTTKVKTSSVKLPIKFTGWMLNPFENIEEFDLLLLTSKNEGLPLVMLEAANYGRATLSRNVGGVGEFIKDGQSGYMVGGDSYKMAEKLKEITQNKNSLKDVGLAANKLLGAEFSVEIMADKYFSLYSELIVSN